MAVSAVSPTYVSYPQTPGSANGPWLGTSLPFNAQPLQNTDSFVASFPSRGAALVSEMIAPFPPNAAPAAMAAGNAAGTVGANDVINAENNGLLAVAAGSVGIGALMFIGLPVAIELAGLRQKADIRTHENNFAQALEKLRLGKMLESKRIFTRLHDEFLGTIAENVKKYSNVDVQSPSHASEGTGRASRAAEEAAHRRAGVARLLVQHLQQHGYDTQDPELFRFAKHQMDLADAGAQVNISSGSHAQKSDQLRFQAWADAVLANGSGTQDAATVARLRPVHDGVARPASTDDIVAFVKGLKGYREGTDDARALYYEVSYEDFLKAHPGASVHAVGGNLPPHIAGHEKVIVWKGYRAPKDWLAPQNPHFRAGKLLGVYVKPSGTGHSNILAQADYSRRHTFERLMGNRHAEKGYWQRTGGRVRGRYGLFFRGSSDTLSNPKAMGGIFGSLIVSSVTLSALLYGALYLIDYQEIRSSQHRQQKQHAIQQATQQAIAQAA